MPHISTNFVSFDFETFRKPVLIYINICAYNYPEKSVSYGRVFVVHQICHKSKPDQLFKAAYLNTTVMWHMI